MAVNRFEVYRVNLDPTVGSEIKKTRPCLVVSPDEMNHSIRTVLVAPMTTRGRPYPTRIRCVFKGRVGQIVLDQLRTVDSSRLVKKLGRLDRETAAGVRSLRVERARKGQLTSRIAASGRSIFVRSPVIPSQTNI